MEHDLKTHPRYFQQVWDRNKPFEIRWNDRGFEVGDSLRLREWDPTLTNYTGRVVKVPKITYLFPGGEYGVDDGVSILGFNPNNITRQFVLSSAYQHTLPDTETLIAEHLLEALHKVDTDTSNYQRWDAGNINEEDVVTLPHLKWMAIQVANHPEWDVDKKNSWIGYITCGARFFGLITVEKQQEFVRECKKSNSQ